MLKDVLKEARTRKGLKQEEVADMVKVAKQTYLKWENGATEPKASQILSLSKALGVSPNEICQGKLNHRYPLDEFIIKQAVLGKSREIETLRAWEHIANHDAYFASLEGTERYSDGELEVLATEESLSR